MDIDFSRLTGDEINREQQRIAREIANSLSLGNITYGIVINNSNYHLKLATESVVNLPPRDAQTGANSRNYAIILLSLNNFTISNDKQPPTIAQPEFQDIETLYSWLRDLPASVNNIAYQMGNPPFVTG